jgi:hypothetical protein
VNRVTCQHCSAPASVAISAAGILLVLCGPHAQELAEHHRDGGLQVGARRLELPVVLEEKVRR